MPGFQHGKQFSQLLLTETVKASSGPPSGHRASTCIQQVRQDRTGRDVKNDIGIGWPALMLTSEGTCLLESLHTLRCAALPRWASGSCHAHAQSQSSQSPPTRSCQCLGAPAAPGAPSQKSLPTVPLVTTPISHGWQNAWRYSLDPMPHNRQSAPWHDEKVQPGAG